MRDPAGDHLRIIDAADVCRHALSKMLLEERDDLLNRSSAASPLTCSGEIGSATGIAPLLVAQRRDRDRAATRVAQGSSRTRGRWRAPRRTRSRVTARRSASASPRASRSRVVAPIPASTPAMPPSVLRTIASIRNCACTMNGLAPTDLRMPISRVRSRTETSIMFMIPIPPTSREMPPSAKVSALKVVVALCALLQDARLILGREVLGIAGRKCVPAAAGPRSSRPRRPRPRTSSSTRTATMDVVRPPSSTRVTIGSGTKIRLSRFSSASCPRAGLSADDLELVAPHPHRLADRILAGEEARGRVQAEHDDVAAEADVGVGDPGACADALVVDGRVCRGHADEPRVGPVPAGRDDQALDVLVGRHEADHRELCDLVDVAGRDRRGRSPTGVCRH